MPYPKICAFTYILYIEHVPTTTMMVSNQLKKCLYNIILTIEKRQLDDLNSSYIFRNWIKTDLGTFRPVRRKVEIRSTHRIPVLSVCKISCEPVNIVYLAAFTTRTDAIHPG